MTCLFGCGKPDDDTMIAVELVRNPAGEFVRGMVENQVQVAWERVPGKAHFVCYDDWHLEAWGYRHG